MAFESIKGLPGEIDTTALMEESASSSDSVLPLNEVITTHIKKVLTEAGG